MPRKKLKVANKKIKKGLKNHAVGQVVSLVKRRVPKKLLRPLKESKARERRSVGETTLIIARGSAAIAAAASAIAAGAFLADEGRRKKVIKGAKEVYKRTKKFRSNLPRQLPDAYYAVSHQVAKRGLLKKVAKTLRKRSSKK